MNIKTKEVKGITLISLVITIVIMLILVGVSINLIIGNNGLFIKTAGASNTYKNASDREQQDLNDNEEEIDKLLGNVKPNNIKTWISYVDSSCTYTTMDDILKDEGLLNKLMNSDKAIAYMVESKDVIMPSIVNNESALTKVICSDFANKLVNNDNEWKEAINSSDIAKVLMEKKVKMGSNLYDHLFQAVNAAEEGKNTTITLLNDIDNEANITVTNGKNVTINLNNHNITCDWTKNSSNIKTTTGMGSLKGVFVCENADLNIIGSGILTLNSNSTSYYYPVICQNGTGTLTVGTNDETEDKIQIIKDNKNYGISMSGSTECTSKINKSVSLSGGTSYAIYDLNTNNNLEFNATGTVTGSIVYFKGKTAVFEEGTNLQTTGDGATLSISGGDVTINGGTYTTIYSPMHTSIIACSGGNTNIYGGTFKGPVSNFAVIASTLSSITYVYDGEFINTNNTYVFRQSGTKSKLYVKESVEYTGKVMGTITKF